MRDNCDCLTANGVEIGIVIALGVLLSRPLVQPSNPAVEGEIRSDACVCDMRMPASTWTRRGVARFPFYCYMVRVQKLSVDLGWRTDSLSIPPRSAIFRAAVAATVLLQLFASHEFFGIFEYSQFFDPRLVALYRRHTSINSTRVYHA